jgi:MFS family permease
MGIFLVGSLLCGLATSIEQLIAFRAVQGLGAAGVHPVVQTIAGDIFSLQERARIQSVMSTVWAVGAVLGPVLGSIIVSVTTWRWVFWINIPISLLAALVLAVSFHERVEKQRHQLDYLGAGILTAGIAALLLALVEGGQSGFGSPLVLGLLLGAGLLLALFLWVETQAPEPIVPLGLLRHRLLGLTSLGGLLVGGCMYSNSSFVPLFVQGAQGRTPLDVAWVMGSMSVVWTVGTVFGGQMLIRSGIRASVIGGMAVTSVGAVLLARLSLDTPFLAVVASAVVVSLGLGWTSIAHVVAVQTAVNWEQRGVATALQQFFRAIGGTLWVSVGGAALSATMVTGLAGAGMQFGGGTAGRAREMNSLLDPTSRALLPPEQGQLLAQVLGDGLHQVFLLYLVAAVAGLITAAFLPSGGMAEHAAAPVAEPARLANR